MFCQICGKEAVISSASGTFCREHFLDYFEDAVLETISKYSLINPHEKIVVANSGGKDSLSLLYVLNKFFRNTNDILSVTIDEGIKGYRDKTIDIMKHYCEAWGINYKIYSYKDFTEKSMDELTKIRHGIPCSYCGTLRRYLLNKAALENNADKMATAHNLDDEAESVLMNLIQNDNSRFLRIGANVGFVNDDKFIPRIKPLMFISEKETMMYSIMMGINAIHSECPYAKFGIRSTVSEIVKEIETSHRGGKRNIVECALTVANSLRGVAERRELNRCRICGAPSSKEVCEACSIKLSLKISI
ncbi:MAG: TIGR00269 family protein [Candidatus Parvarchaeota archaeon]